MWNSFLYVNPVAPAVIGLCVSVVLGAYWLSRLEVTRGERAEGPAAAHPLALLVQGALVLAADLRLLVLLLTWAAVQSGAGWALSRPWQLRVNAQALSVWGGLDPAGLHEHLTQGFHAIRALEDSLPGAQHLVPSGLLIPLVGLVLSWLLLRHVLMDNPEWAQGAEKGAALGVGVPVLVLSAFALPYGLAQMRQFTAGTPPAGAWQQTALALAFLPVSAFVGLCLLSAMFEMATERTWNPSSVARRVVAAYWPWLTWTLVAGALTVARMLLHAGAQAWIPGPADTVLTAVSTWLPVVLFPLPWLLLERPEGFPAVVSRCSGLLRRRPVLAFLFAVRYAAILSPVLFVLGALQTLWGQGLAPVVVWNVARIAVGAVCSFAVCRATLSLLRDDDVTGGGEGLAGAE